MSYDGALEEGEALAWMDQMGQGYNGMSYDSPELLFDSFDTAMNA